METFFIRLTKVVMSMHAILAVLLITLLGLLTFTHTLFNEILPETIQGPERLAATWLLSCGWEVILLLATVNSHLLPKRITLLMAICSGLIVLFFLHAFEFDMPAAEIFKRWFVGLLVTLVNYLYTFLFYAKYLEFGIRNDLKAKLEENQILLSTKERELEIARERLIEIEKALAESTTLVAELEQFKVKELSAKICPYCGAMQKSVYHVNSHKGVCPQNPKRGLKQSIFDEVVA